MGKYDKRLETFEGKYASTIPSFIDNGINQDTIDFAKKLAKELTSFEKKEEFTSTQFRNFYGELKRIEMEKGDNYKSPSFFLLIPRLAYNIKRNGKEGHKPFLNMIELAHKRVDSPVKFNRFCDFIEAILAYFKYYGGK